MKENENENIVVGQKASEPDFSNLNWGAFFLTWIWGIANKTWSSFFVFLFAQFNLVLLIRGNEWAWRNRKFKDVDEFNAVQRKWSIWGWILFLLFIVVIIIASKSMVSSLIKLFQNLKK